MWYLYSIILSRPRQYSIWKQRSVTFIDRQLHKLSEISRWGFSSRKLKKSTQRANDIWTLNMHVQHCEHRRVSKKRRPLLGESKGNQLNSPKGPLLSRRFSPGLNWSFAEADLDSCSGGINQAYLRLFRLCFLPQDRKSPVSSSRRSFFLRSLIFSVLFLCD